MSFVNFKTGLDYSTELARRTYFLQLNRLKISMKLIKVIVFFCTILLIILLLDDSGKVKKKEYINASGIIIKSSFAGYLDIVRNVATLLCLCRIATFMNNIISICLHIYAYFFPDEGLEDF